MKSVTVLLLLPLQLALCYTCGENDNTLEQCTAFNIVFPLLIPRELVADDAQYAEYVNRRKAVFSEFYSCTEATEAEWVGADLVFTERGRIIDKTEFKNWTYNGTHFKIDLEEDYNRVYAIISTRMVTFFASISDKAERAIWYSLSKNYPFAETEYIKYRDDMKNWMDTYQTERCEFTGNVFRLQYWAAIYNWSDDKPEVVPGQNNSFGSNSSATPTQQPSISAPLPFIMVLFFGSLALTGVMCYRNRHRSSNHDIVQETITPVNDLTTTILGDLIYVESKIKRLRYSAFFPYSLTLSLNDFLIKPCFLSQSDRYEPPSWLNFHDDLAPKGYKLWGYVDVVLGIEFYKTFSFFNRLSSNDRLALLRGTLVQIRMFHSAYDAFFRGHAEIAVDPDGNVPFSSPYFRCSSLNRLRQSCCLKDCQELRVTMDQAVVLKTIIALNSSAPNLSQEGQELIENERIKHVKALLQLVQVEHPKDWVTRFSRLCHVVTRNISTTQYMQELFLCKILPLVVNGTKIEKIWLELML
ncbi:hypothetical protein QR680_017878 [Steinernema hermaphroditum]|uniref:NR LBD domain-containing protein n=1 Tax=Steinernema hermaphroditum TaxID=289476 RepID=A0AA39HG55_9BILA|nr:hypothetical protein QR680_017878 [Steinernema hermaphroditum]